MTIAITFQNPDHQKAVLHFLHQFNISIDALHTYLKKSFIRACKILGVNDRISKCTIALMKSRTQLGAYHSELSSTSDFYFSVSISHVFSCMQSHAEKLDYLWIHELAHAFDYDELSRFSKSMQKYEREWAGKSILDALVSLRHEGFATLMQELCGSDLANSNKIPDEPFDYYNQVFVGYYDMILNQQIDMFIFSHFEFEEYGSMYKSHAYQYGRPLIMNALYYKYPHYRPIIVAISHKFREGKAISMDDFQGLPLLFDFPKISTEEFIFINMQSKVKLPFPDRLSLKVLFMVQLFYKYDHSLLYELNPKKSYAYAQFLENILNSDINFNPKDFEYFKPKMISEDATMARLYISYTKSMPDGIFKDLLTKVYNRWLAHKDEFSCWQLSYVFHRDDIIEDFIPYIGHIDDMMVLDMH